MRFLFDFLFNPPPLPPIELPLPARMIPGIKTTITVAFKLAYERGVYDGFVAGVLATMMFIPSIRGRAMKGASHVVDAL